MTLLREVVVGAGCKHELAFGVKDTGSAHFEAQRKRHILDVERIVSSLADELLGIDRVVLFEPVLGNLYVALYFLLRLHCPLCVLQVDFLKSFRCVNVVVLRRVDLRQLDAHESVLRMVRKTRHTSSSKETTRGEMRSIV